MSDQYFSHASERWYLVWSEEHGMWWESRSGYTHFMSKAARYTKAAADEIVAQGNLVIHPESGFLADRKFNEIAIPDPLQ